MTGRLCAEYSLRRPLGANLFWLHNASMKYRAIIRDAWVLTQENKSLIWWFAFAPALVSTLVAMGYVFYQLLLFWGEKQGDVGGSALWAKMYDRAIQLSANHPALMVVFVVISASIGLAYMMLPVFSQGALIQLIARMRKGHPLSIMEGFGLGLRRFLQLFEFHLLVSTFSLVSTITVAVSVYRYLGVDAFVLFSWVFGIVLFVGLFLTLLFTYSEYYIALEDRGMLKGMLMSSSLVVRHWHHTLFMLILMTIISIRIFINLVIALLIPLLIMGSVLLFGTFASAKIGLVIGGILGLVALYFTSYFVGVFNVFTTAVWTFTFMELRLKKEMILDDSEGEDQVSLQEE